MNTILVQLTYVKKIRSTVSLVAWLWNGVARPITAYFSDSHPEMETGDVNTKSLLSGTSIQHLEWLPALNHSTLVQHLCIADLGNNGLR